jgi:hypothetical protein
MSVISVVREYSTRYPVSYVCGAGAASDDKRSGAPG